MSVTMKPRWMAGAAVGSAGVAALIFIITGSPGGSEAASQAPDPAQFHVAGDGMLSAHRPALRSPADPLSADEVRYATYLAVHDASVPADARDVLGEPGPEVLLADLPGTSTSGTARRAVVQLFDYAAGRSYYQAVNLSAGTVVSRMTRTAVGPITATEADVAAQLAIQHRPALPFSDEFAAANGVPLVDADQITYIVGSFVYDGSTPRGSACRVDRCAQLMVRDASGTYLDTVGFVVNLSSKTIVEVR